MNKSRFDFALLFMLVGSLSFNVYLFSRTGHAAPNTPKQYNSRELAGRDAPSIPVTSLAGVDQALREDGRPLLLYVLRPGCNFCDRNAENMRALAKQLKNYRIVGLSLQRAGLEDYLKQFPLPFEVFSVVNYRDPALAPYGFGATPALYLVEHGKIQRAWGGLLTGVTRKDVEAVFSISLPGPTD